MLSTGLIVALLFIGGTHSKSVPAPSFVLNQDRASDGSPSVSITFPDGYTDSLALSRYYSNARDKLARVEKCHFFGHLEGEPEACVAMTGCPGSDDLEFTILSKHSPDTMFKWTKNGDVQVIKSPFATGNARSEVLVREDETNQPGNWTLVGGDEEVNPAIEAAEAEIAASCTDADCESVPETNLLTLRFGYDEGFLAVTGSHDDAKAYIESTIPHIQTLYCHSSSLGTKIQLETVEEPKYVEGKYLTASVDSIVEMQPNTAEDLGEADLMVYMGWESAYSGVIGIAWKSTVCRPASWDSDDVKSSINEWRETHAEAGHLIAHELGHNLGMDHDFTDAHAAAGCDNTGVMSYGEAVYQWSTCSASDLQAHYILMKDYWCMPLEPSACGTEDDGGETSGEATTTTTTTTTTTVAADCVTSWIGDSFCDDENNVAECEFDGGDCCEPHAHRRWNRYCNACNCLE